MATAELTERVRNVNVSEEEPLPLHWAPAGLRENLDLLTDDELALALMLTSEGQEHLFLGWPAPGMEDDDKHRFFSQVGKLDEEYSGGLAAYIQNARQLLADSREGKNPFEGYTPSVPAGEKLMFGDVAFEEYEARGVREARSAAFVLVAGGLGERLGYSGIKVALPSQTTTGQTFLGLYCQTILALQEASNALCPQEEESRRIPLAIMTSDDTHAATQRLLEEHAFFGLQPSQVHLLKQEKVACLADNEASLAAHPSDRYSLQTKPHGHGDVHSLLHRSGLLPTWQRQGLQWVLFFQDTNGLLFKAIPASLGVSAVRDFDVNSLAVPRKAKEAIGGIAKLTHSHGKEMVVNVEYNQLDPLLRATGHIDGDMNDASGFSPFPGNINQLVIKLGPYIDELARTNGAIVEFVNPKYKDAGRSAFKAATRLECMMQDYPKSLPPSARVGFTEMDVWLAYSPVKNNAADAAAKVAAGTPAHSATSGELQIYRANCLILRQVGVDVEGPVTTEFAGQQSEVWARVVWSPQWALTLADVRAKVSGQCKLSQASTLVLDGKGIAVHNLDLDGALVVKASEGAEVRLSNLGVHNKGWQLEPIDPTDSSIPEEIRIRGFRIVRHEQREIVISQSGEHVISS